MEGVVMRRSLVVLAFVLIAGCGGVSDTTPATAPTSPTTPSAATTPVPTTDVAPDTVPAPSPPDTTATSSAPPDTTVPPDTTPPSPTTTVVAGDGVLGRPDPTLLEALPAETIPWDEVGPDWLAFAYPRSTTTQWEEAGRQGMYLVDPDDRIYAVSALPIDGTDVVEVSWSGRLALLRGPYAAGLPLTVLDLETTIVHEVVRQSEDLDHYALTSDGTGLWIYDLPWTNPPTGGGTASVTHLDLATLARTTVLEESVALDPLVDFYDWWVNNRGGIAELPSGEIVAGMPSGVWIGSPDEGDFHPFELPSAACAVVDVWDDTTVLVRCKTTKLAACEGYESELWLVPIDGRAPSLLAAPDADACVSYSGAVPLADHLAIRAGFGSGECNGHVLVRAPDGTVERWVPPLAEVDCNEWVVGVRNGTWLVQAANPYVDRDFPIALFEVTPTGARQIDLPAAWVMLLTP
jgi:hypothetical protein